MSLAECSEDRLLSTGKLTDNAFVESFNGIFQAKCLDTHWFIDLKEAKQLIEPWRWQYNKSRPHAFPKDRTPSEVAKESAASRSPWQSKPAAD